MNFLSEPLVSVVTPSYNSAAFLDETIRSVLSQNYPNLEYIVMDGGSTDGTLETLQSYGNRIQYFSEPDKGPSDAVHKGFQNPAPHLTVRTLEGALARIVCAFPVRISMLLFQHGPVVHQGIEPFPRPTPVHRPFDKGENAFIGDITRPREVEVEEDTPDVCLDEGDRQVKGVDENGASGGSSPWGFSPAGLPTISTISLPPLLATSPWPVPISVLNTGPTAGWLPARQPYPRLPG